MKTISGIRPSGRLHLGNYLGSIKPALEHDAFVLIAEYHAPEGNADDLDKQLLRFFPEDKILLQREAELIWKTYDDTHGYATEKISYLKSFGNVGDNFGTIIGMFDIHNQRKLYDAVGPEAREAINSWNGRPLDIVEDEARQMGLL